MFDQYKITGDNVAVCFADDKANFFEIKFAGQTNRAYLDAFQKASVKFQDSGRTSEDEAHAIMVSIFMDTLLHHWGCINVDGKKVLGKFLDSKTNEIVDYNFAKVQELLMEAPLLFNVLHRFAQNRSNYSAMKTVEGVAGN